MVERGSHKAEAPSSILGGAIFINTMKKFIGVIIEESLENRNILKKVKIIKTEIEPVTPEHKTPWIKQWTLHTVEISENQAREIAQELSKSLDSQNHWYADFKNDSYHYIMSINLKPHSLECGSSYCVLNFGSSKSPTNSTL